MGVKGGFAFFRNSSIRLFEKFLIKEYLITIIEHLF